MLTLSKDEDPWTWFIAFQHHRESSNLAFGSLKKQNPEQQRIQGHCLHSQGKRMLEQGLAPEGKY